MSGVTIATPPLVYVSWSCRRCGHTGGMARTTFPIDTRWTEGMGRTLFDQLRLKLVRVHQAKQACIAVPDDFVITRFDPSGTPKHLVGTV
jgi:hypothetical protein